MSWIGHFLAVGVFGVAVPLRQGLDFLDVMFLLAYACLPCLFAAPLVAESVAGRKTQPPAEGYIAQVATPFLFATFWSILILSSALASVNAANWYGKLVLPPKAILWNIIVLSVAATAFASAVTGWLALNVASAATAKSHARRLFLLVLLAVLMYARMAPLAWKRIIESRLTAEGISWVLLPLSAALLGVAALFLRAGASRRTEEAAGPLLKL
ncbi:MAG: hypothetical protein JNK48_09340 [Bryobacterales bacterium]|nr:hypothetical protein [Bryobacterales bacterium]